MSEFLYGTVNDSTIEGNASHGEYTSSVYEENPCITEAISVAYETYERDELKHAYHAYADIVGALQNEDIQTDKPELLTPDDFSAELKQWVTDERKGALRQLQESHPEASYRLIARPNNIVTSEEIRELADYCARSFCNVGSVERSYVDTVLLDLYELEDLSKPDHTESPVTFRLISDKQQPPSSYKKVAEYLEVLGNENPHIYIPSVYDAITYWLTLYRSGSLDARGAYTQDSVFHHHDIGTRRIKSDEVYPTSVLWGVGSALPSVRRREMLADGSEDWRPWPDEHARPLPRPSVR